MIYRQHREPRQIDNNRYRQTFFTGNVQYNDGGGWCDIDTTLRDLNGTHWHMYKAPYTVMIPKFADGEITYRHEGHGFSWIAQGTRKICGTQTGKNVVYYNNAYADGISLEISVGNNRFTKNIVLEKRPDVRGEFIEFRFKMPYDGITAIHDGLNYRNQKELRWVHAMMRLCENEHRATYVKPVSVAGADGEIFTVPLLFEYENDCLVLVKKIPVSMLANMIYPVRIDSSASYIAGTGDGCVSKNGATWALAHDAATGTGYDYTSAEARVGCQYGGTVWTFYRSFLPFDTSALPGGSMIESATLQLFAIQANTLNVVKTFQASTSSLATADYEDCGYDTGNDTGARAKYTPIVKGAADWNIINNYLNTCSLNDIGLSWVDPDGVTKLGLREIHDCTNTRFTGYFTVWYTANHSDAELQPQLSLEYSTSATYTHGDGGLAWGGQNVPTIEITMTGSGGFGIGGATSIIQPISWYNDNAISLASLARTPVSWSTTGDIYAFANAVVDYKKPYKYWRSLNASSEITKSITWDGDVDTIILYNCNFDSVTLTAISPGQDFTTVQDNNTGMYHLVARLNTSPASGYAQGTKTIEITIPVQTPNDGNSYFKIGSIIGAKRSEFTTPPQMPISREYVEPVITRQYYAGNKEIERLGNPYHILTLHWNEISFTELDVIRTAIANIDIDGACVLHEKYSDYEAAYLCHLFGDPEYSYDSISRASATIVLRELN